MLSLRHDEQRLHIELGDFVDEVSALQGDTDFAVFLYKQDGELVYDYLAQVVQSERYLGGGVLDCDCALA